MATVALFAECKSDLQKFASVARPKIRELFGGFAERKTALVAYTPKEAVESCDIVFACTSDPASARAVVFGEDGVLRVTREYTVSNREGALPLKIQELPYSAHPCSGTGTGSSACWACSCPLFIRKFHAASSFARAAPARQAVQAKAEDMVGACAPLGFFDPLGLSKDAAKAAWYREAELKHGRVAMLAALGWMTTATGFHPLIDALGIPAGATPLDDAAHVPYQAWPQLIFFMGCAEEFQSLLKKNNPNYQPGDLLGATEYMDKDDVSWQRYQLAELNNGRLAMMAMMGFIAESQIYGHPLLGLREGGF